MRKIGPKIRNPILLAPIFGPFSQVFSCFLDVGAVLFCFLQGLCDVTGPYGKLPSIAVWRCDAQIRACFCNVAKGLPPANSSLSASALALKGGGGGLKMTVRFLYGAGAETLIFVPGTSGKKSETFRLPAEKPKSAVDTQKTKKNRCLGYPVLRSKPQRWIPELQFGYPPLRNFPKPFWEKLGIFLESLGGSQRQLWIKTRPLEEIPKMSRFRAPFPDLPFLAFWKTARKPPKKQGFFGPGRTPKIPGKEGKNAPKKTRNSLQKEKQGTPKKTRKGRSGLVQTPLGSLWGKSIDVQRAKKGPKEGDPGSPRQRRRRRSSKTPSRTKKYYAEWISVRGVNSVWT